MLKTVNVKKNMRLDELIKYIFDNDVKSKEFFIHGEGEVESPRNLTVDYQGMVRFYFGIYSGDIFTVEVEEEITEDTVFDTLVDVNNNDEVRIAWNDSISLYDKEQTKEIHAIVNGKLELIWEAE